MDFPHHTVKFLINDLKFLQALLWFQPVIEISIFPFPHSNQQSIQWLQYFTGQFPRHQKYSQTGRYANTSQEKKYCLKQRIRMGNSRKRNDLKFIAPGRPADIITATLNSLFPFHGQGRAQFTHSIYKLRVR